MDLLEELNKMWSEMAFSFFMFLFLVFVIVLIWQAIKNKKEQAKILEQYKRNLEILRDLKNRF